MTLDEARQLLDAVRAGTSNPPWSRVRLALQMTGDIPGAWSSQELRRVPEGGAVGEGCGVKPQNAPGAHEAADGYHPITEWSIVQPRPGKRPSRAIAGCEAE